MEWTHHGLDLHVFVLMYILLKQEVWVGYIKDNLFKILKHEHYLLHDSHCG